MSTIEPSEKNWQESKTFFRISVLLVLLVSGGLILCEYFFNQQMLSRDGSKYLIYVHEALEHGWTAAAGRYPEMNSYPPLLVSFMYYGGKLGFSCEWTGRVLNIVSILLAALGVLAICRELYKDKFTALMTALALSAIPKMYIEGCDILRDPLFWAEITWATALILRTARSEQPPKKVILQVILLAILCGLSIITRKEGAFFTLLAALWLLTLFPAPSRRFRAVMLILFLLLAILPALLTAAGEVPWDMSTSFIPEKEQ